MKQSLDASSLTHESPLHRIDILNPNMINSLKVLNGYEIIENLKGKKMKKQKETHRIEDGEATVTTGAASAIFRTVWSTC